MTRLTAAFGFALGLLANTAAAQPCEEFTAFAKGEGAPKVNERAATCSSSKVLGGSVSIDCYWVFDYRADEAQRSFQKMVEDLALCVDDGLHKEATSVNHPDSFDQVTGHLGGQDVSLSLKDKGGLGQTLIFLRATRP